MSNLKPAEVSEFFNILAEAQLIATEMSVIELDRYIKAFIDGARTVDQLREAVLDQGWPREVTIYVSADQNDLYEVGSQLGLNPDACRAFASFREIPLLIDVNEDGSGVIKSLGLVEV